jgi:hypothetical protein
MKEASADNFFYLAAPFLYASLIFSKYNGGLKIKGNQQMTIDRILFFLFSKIVNTLITQKKMQNSLNKIAKRNHQL